MPSYHHAGVMRQGHADERHHEACEPWDLGPEEQGSGHEQQRAPAVNQAGADPPPSGLITMASGALRRVLPRVEAHVHHWRAQAQTIPSDELRKQALASIESKAFHCAGGGMYALLAGEGHSEAVRFIVAYQTISDYLDNLCDRSTSLDPDDFRLLHTSMLQALTPGVATGTATGAAAPDYYCLREDQADGGYLAGLVATCQEVLASLPDYAVIAPHLHELAGYYCDLQVHKHIHPLERVAVMEAWFAEHRDAVPPMTWYEFAACSGSTLGIFALVAYACRGGCDAARARAVRDAYFPWVQGLHILMDYLIDQGEDREGGDLNFCAFYPDDATLLARLSHFYHEADLSVSGLPDRRFHRFINRGLLAIYGSDPKVPGQRAVRRVVRRLVLRAGGPAWFFYTGCRLYRRLVPDGLLGGPKG